MTLPLEPAHLPKLPVSQEAYERLYAFNQRSDDYRENDADWQVVRIKPGLAEDAVYRLLPSASGFEFGGYLTKSRIRFFKCDPTRATIPMSKPCTFHSHPTDLATADIPSPSDVFQFLTFQHLRTVTVGSTRLWVWDKTRATLNTVKKLAIWSEANLLTEARRLEKKAPYAWHEPYMKLVLKHLGLDWPKKIKDWEANWTDMLRDILKIKVRIFPRDSGIKAT